MELEGEKKKSTYKANVAGLLAMPRIANPNIVPLDFPTERMKCLKKDIVNCWYVCFVIMDVEEKKFSGEEMILK